MLLNMFSFIITILNFDLTNMYVEKLSESKTVSEKNYHNKMYCHQNVLLHVNTVFLGFYYRTIQYTKIELSPNKLSFFLTRRGKCVPHIAVNLFLFSCPQIVLLIPGFL